MTDTGKAVFLSYASQDAPAALRLCEILRQAGIEVWLDQSELAGGDEWDRKIRRLIRECSLFVPIISRNTQARAEGYFRLEWKIADERTHLMAKGTPFLLPVSIDGTGERGALVPDSFLAVQWSDAPDGQVPPAFVEHLKRLLGAPPAAEDEAKWLPQTARGSPGKRWPWPAFAAVAVAATIVAALFWQPWKAQAPATGRPAADNAHPAGEPGAAAAQTLSVAVLPFANLSGQKENEFLSDGISEDLLNLLAKIPGLKVSARTSSFHYKGKDTPTAEIARQLGVTYLVEGSVQRVGERVRITAQLVKASDGFRVWSERFDRELKDIFAVQDEIAGLIAGALRLRLGRAPGEGLAVGTTRNPEAYEAYLKGRWAWVKPGFSPDDYDTAVQHLQQAVKLDPQFALAYGALAEAYVSLGNSWREPPKKVFPLAREAAERALALDKGIVQAYTALAEIAFHFDWDYAQGDQYLEQALAADPNYAVAWARKADHLGLRNRREEARVASNKAMELDPAEDTPVNRIWTLGINERRLDEATAMARRELKLNGGNVGLKLVLALMLMIQGSHQEGLQLLEELAAAHPGATSDATLGWAYGRTGQPAKAREVLRRMENKGKSRFVSPVARAEVYAGLDDRDRAFAELERAFEMRDPRLPGIVVSPYFESIRGDQRFPPMIRRLKLEPYFPQFAAPARS